MKLDTYYTVLKSWANCKIGRVPSSPLKVIANLTGACQSLCKTCNWGRNFLSGNYNTKQELSTDQWITTFSSVKQDLVWLTLGGGEPTMRPDFADIVLGSERNCPHLLGTDFSTNGISPKAEEKLIAKLLPATKLIINASVSLDGNRQEHDFIRGQNGNFDSAIQTYRMLKEYSTQYKNLQIHFNHTISDFSAGHMKEFFEGLRQEGITPSIDNISLCFAITAPAFSNLNERTTPTATYDLHYDLTKAKSDLDAYLNLDKGSLSGFNGLRKIMKYIDIHMARDKYLSGITPVARCASLRMSCHVTPTGDVHPCTVLGTSIGNLKDYNFNLKKVWDSPRANEMRTQLKKDLCKCCSWSGCETSSTIIANFPQDIRWL